MAIQFKEIRQYLARNARLSICFEDGYYQDYLMVSDIPTEKYKDLYNHVYILDEDNGDIFNGCHIRYELLEMYFQESMNHILNFSVQQIADVCIPLRLWQSLGCTKAVLLCSQRDVWRDKQL